MKHVLCPTFRRADCTADIKLGTLSRQGNKRCKRYSTSRSPVTPTPKKKKSIGLESHSALQTEKQHAIKYAEINRAWKLIDRL